MYFIPISNGILEDSHHAKIGGAIWQYMWIIDKVTSIDKDGFGHVLGGKPVKLKELALSLSEKQASRNLQKLQKEGYITLKRTPYGVVIAVTKAKKRFTKNVRPESKRTDKNVLSDGQECPISRTEMSDTKKTVSVDNTVDSKESPEKPAATPSKETLKKKTKKELYADTTPMTCSEFLEYCRKSPQKHLKIIAEWAEAESPPYTTKGQWRRFLQRNVRPAMDLTPFSIDQLQAAYDKLQKDVERIDPKTGKKTGFITKYTLETLGKYT